MYQENNHRKWLSSPGSNPPLENLKTFLQKRIKAIMAKEWWDFIVNVNTLNSDHASLLYSLANLCPSFNYFLQSKDKELQLIVKKRPVVKPRIFSGTERIDTTPEPIVPKQFPLVTRRNSASELVKILNDLYPNENIVKSKQPRTYGPASKQKKTSQGPNKKNLSVGDFTKKTSVPPNGSCGRSPLLTRLLADESQKENALIANTKKMAQSQLSLPVLLEENEDYSKGVLSNTNYDLNQNRLNQTPRKIKKIIKVKKKRYVYSNALTDPKNRLKFILEDETPNLSLKLIKKYRIKKCSIDLVRLKDSVLKYYDELKYRNAEKNASEQESLSNVLPIEGTQFTSLQVTDEHSNSSMNPITQSATMPLLSDKDEGNEKNASSLERLNPIELKNVYCHGGIVPLGKVLSNEKVISDLKNSKHFLSLKEKKLKEIINDKYDTVIKSKVISSKIDKTEIETQNNDGKVKGSEIPLTNESVPSGSPYHIAMEINEQICSSDVSVLDNITNVSNKNSENCNESLTNVVKKPGCSFQEVDLVSSKMTFIGKNDVGEIHITDRKENVCDDFVVESTNDNISETNVNNRTPEPSEMNCESLKKNSVTCIDESSVSSSDKAIDYNEMEVTEHLTKLKNVEKNQTTSDVDKLTSINCEPEIIDKSSVENSVDDCITVDKNKKSFGSNDSICNETEDLEPLAKRPRIALNLTEMKLEITKTIVESRSNDDHVCKMCKLSFDSAESWDNHFENNVPKCTPNLKVTWDNTELSVLTE